MKKQARLVNWQANPVPMDSQTLLECVCYRVASSGVGFEGLQRDFSLHVKVRSQANNTEADTRQAAARAGSGAD